MHHRLRAHKQQCRISSHSSISSYTTHTLTHLEDLMEAKAGDVLVLFHKGWWEGKAMQCNAFKFLCWPVVVRMMHSSTSRYSCIHGKCLFVVVSGRGGRSLSLVMMRPQWCQMKLTIRCAGCHSKKIHICFSFVFSGAFSLNTNTNKVSALLLCRRRMNNGCDDDDMMMMNDDDAHDDLDWMHGMMIHCLGDADDKAPSTYPMPFMPW